ncbi:hypothetical protein QAD02_001354 [Eretmocerus hayati]|uniref:Uncharacterized protein n=1 Tax=Eretmocerus hayati TaxID=131215 RepID=A0ACC2NKK8_9HYME|nr:hypothetical protein QAD02_001354 [Eretmocerus hayati]
MIRIIVLTFALTTIFCKDCTAKEIVPNEDSTQWNLTAETPTEEYPTNLDISDGENKAESSQRSSRSDPGFLVPIGQYSFVVALYDDHGDFMCPGTILKARLILTAHHCIAPFKPFSIRADSHDLHSGGQKIKVKDVIKYPGADKDGSPLPHDLALVVLSESIKNARRVTLVDPKDLVPERSIVNAVGWGRKSFGNPRLLWASPVQMSVISNCQNIYGVDWMCVDTVKTAVCVGDAGGPIMYEGKQIGIVSHTNDPNKCGSGIPAALVNLKKYVKWINKQVEKPGYD